MAKAEQKQSEFPAYKPQSVASLVPYARNSRTHSAQQVDKIAASIREFGFLNPVIVDGQQGIIAGHGRVLAAQKLGLAEVPTIEASHLTEAQRRAYVIADNRLALDAGWDVDMLKVEIADLKAVDFDLSLTGFSLLEIEAFDPSELPNGSSGGAGSLAEKFGIPPFSVLNAREGWWQSRKASWLDMGIRSELGRGEGDRACPGGGSPADQVAKAATARRQKKEAAHG